MLLPLLPLLLLSAGNEDGEIAAIAMLLGCREKEGFPADDVSSSFCWLMFVASHDGDGDGDGGGGMAMVLGFGERTRQMENLVQTSFLETAAAFSDGDGGAGYGYGDGGGK